MVASNPVATSVNVTDSAGGIESILFLDGGEPTGAAGPNWQTAQVYATFWIDQVPPKDRNLGWPHISAATLRKSFN